MEKRLLLFFALTFLIVSLWWRIFPPPPMTDETAVPPPVSEEGTDVRPEARDLERRAEEREARPEVGRKVEEEASGEAAEKDVPPVKPRAAEREERVVVETDLYRMELSNRGAVITSVRLKEHENSRGEPYEMVPQQASDYLDLYPGSVRLPGEGRAPELTGALFELESPRRVDVAGEQKESIEFYWADGLGLEVTKRFLVEGSSYEIETDVSVRDRGEEIGKEVLYGPGVGNEVTEGQYVGVDKGVVVARGEVELFTAEEVEEGEGASVSITATGVTSHYFAGLMVPRGEGIYGARFEHATIPAEELGGRERQVITAILDAPRSPAEFTLYIGPKKLERLEALAPGMAQIIEFGAWMRYPALLLRAGLMKIYEYVGNYGWAIVLLTVVINLLLVPLKHYSFVSMRKMQKLAPQIQHIRDRYKKVKPTDPRYQHMNQEIMNLYKEHKVSPVSGCLPMLLMIPFFFAFYRLLMASVELRHAPFVFWIQDLSRHDPYFVLPILMGVSQLAIQKMTPQTTADPMQAKIMSFMPVIFTFILAWAPSGLVLYWFANNMVSMGQQVATNKILVKQEEEAAEQEKAAKRRKGKKGTKGARK